MGAHLGTLEELSTVDSMKNDWDQFKVNESLFGVVSTFKMDLSQYTTPLNIAEVPLHVRKRADQLASAIEQESRCSVADDWEAVGTLVNGTMRRHCSRLFLGTAAVEPGGKL